MRFIADFHIHSRFSRATSRDLDLEHLELWARRKGLTVVGTGDFTHPEWLAELEDRLEPAEPGLFRLKEALCVKDDPWAPDSPQPVRFILSAEISNIYKKGDKVRKVHNLIMVPDFESARKISLALDRIGNIKSDGRPILGLDSKNLLEIALESSDNSCFIPAHIWTPWFSILGSKSGFDSVEECFDDLTPHIFALETGLSSDPAMNWRLSSLDRFALVSNSDAHSPPNLAREANVFDTEVSYFAMISALERRDPEEYLGTIEFFPQEGKYHYDGHRKCDMCMDPKDTRSKKGLCPVCGKAVTIGVMHRVEELADREDGHKPEGAAPYRSLIPLPEIISGIVGVGKASKKVKGEYFRLLKSLGPELEILERMPVDKISGESEVLGEAIRRMRAGKVIIREGYDGEYGIITLFEPEELKGLGPQKNLFAGPGASASKKKIKEDRVKGEFVSKDSERLKKDSLPAESLFSADSPQVFSSPVTFGLNSEQEEAVKTEKGPIMIVAGPGTGKTRTLTHRIAYLIQEKGLAPEKALAITFTNKARDEMQDRLVSLIPDKGKYQGITIKTFHALGLQMIREEAEALGMEQNFTILGEDERMGMIAGILGTRSSAKVKASLAKISDAKQKLLLPDEAPEKESEFISLYRAYQDELEKNLALDFDDLIMLPVRLLRQNQNAGQRWQARYDSISIDEYQDINHAQYEMVRLIAPGGDNLCVIGDPDQSIYGFRGAEPAYFLKFPEDYPGAKIFRLERNYRSSESIIQASRQVISHLASPHRPRLFSEAPGPMLTIAELASDKAEAEFVVHRIERMVGGTGFFSLDSGRVDSSDQDQEMSFSDFAVLYRMDALSGPLVEAFARSGIPFQKVGETHLAQNEFRSIIAAITMLQNPACDIAAQDALKFLLESQGKDAFKNLSALCRKKNITLWQGLIESRGQLAVEMKALQGMIGKIPVIDLIDRIFNLPQLGSPKPEALIAARNFLQNTAARYGVHVDEFLEASALASPQDFYDERADRVALLTLHAAKGLEFGSVFIVGMEDGITPYIKDKASTTEIEEERRIFYVGVTRAKQILYLTRAKRRALFGPTKARQPSPFLKDIQKELIRKASLPSRKAKRVDPQLKMF